MRQALPAAICKAVLFITLLLSSLTACTDPELSDRERRIFSSLSLSNLPAPQQPSNKYLTNTQAQSFGQQLFHDAQLSRSGAMSCATCHQPDKHYTDARRTPETNGLDNGSVNRNTPTLLGVAWNTWQYWDGRRDSLWSQALTPIEAPAEMASNRVAAVRLLLSNEAYRHQYETIFGPISLNPADVKTDASPIGDEAGKREWYKIDRQVQHKINTVFANIGKALGAYQSTLKPPVSRFDQYLDALRNNQSPDGILTRQELAGARLFINDKKTQCLECHNGPLMTNGDFHSIGSGTFSGDNMDFGRTFGAQAVMIDEFNCQGRYSDAGKGECKHLQFLNRTNLAHTRGAFKTPGLRNVANTAPYFHDGRYATLREAVMHYNNPPPPLPNPNHDLRDFTLNEKEIKNLLAFLNTLTAITK